jgi:3-keto-disaccharide hydrolase
VDRLPHTRTITAANLERRAWLTLVAAVLVGRASRVETQSTQPLDWRSLFDGRTLGQWKPTNFGGEGEVHVRDGEIVLERGNDLTGITWTGDIARMDYEIELEAKRVSGGDFFCGLTFPVGDSYCSFIVGGWAGAVVGLSSLDGHDASENETTRVRNFEQNRWYKIRVRVTADRIQAWIDEETFADVKTTGRKISIRPEVQDSRPLGIASWRTTAALRSIRMRNVSH